MFLKEESGGLWGVTELLRMCGRNQKGSGIYRSELEYCLCEF